MLYLIGGRCGSGKSTLGKIIRKNYERNGKRACVMQVSSTLKNYCRNYFGWDGKEKDKPRDLLQHIGVDIIRDKLGMEDFLVKRLVEDIKILDEYFDIVIVTDIRFPNEFEILSNEFLKTVKILVTRPKYEANLTTKQKQDLSEVSLDNFQGYDYKIINRNLEDLENDILKIVEMEDVK